MPSAVAGKDSGRHSMTNKEIDDGGRNGDQNKSDGGGKGVDSAYENKLRWYQRLNPIRLQKPPPVPTERAISKEHGASLLSVITFQWMHPLMMVSFLPGIINVLHLITTFYLDGLPPAPPIAGYLAGKSRQVRRRTFCET